MRLTDDLREAVAARHDELLRLLGRLPAGAGR
jgi:hypothetical protein